jgi:hypothetical protein
MEGWSVYQWNRTVPTAGLSHVRAVGGIPSRESPVSRRTRDWPPTHPAAQPVPDDVSSRSAVPASLTLDKEILPVKEIVPAPIESLAAHNDLDASAAREVWPAVDERALARAFDDLTALHISLGECDVRVSGDSARAACSGSATWSPKIGGGQRTAARRWAFELRDANGAWRMLKVLIL